MGVAGKKRRAGISLLLFCVSATCVLGQQQDTRLLQQYAAQGQKALVEKRYAEAEKAYEKLRHLDPGTAEIHAQLGFIYFQEKKFDQAVSSLRRAVKLKPGLPNTDILLAMSLCELGRYRQALSGLENGFRRSRDAALKRMAGLELERAYTGLQQDDKAVEVALELNRLYPKDPEVLYQTGRLTGNFAYLTMMRLSRVAPNSAWTHLAVGEAQESEKAYDLAINQYRKVLALDPGRPGIHYRIGRTLLLRWQHSKSQTKRGLTEAAKEFEQELQVDPTNANAAYELGEIHRKQGNLKKARELFAMALKYYPDFQQAEVGMGRLLMDLGKPRLALPHLRKAISLNPNDDVPYYLLARVYGALHDTAEQRKTIAEYQRLRRERSRQEDTFLRRAVTKQEVDSRVKR